MISIKGYIHGNTVIAQDESLREFDGRQILVQIPDVAEKGRKNIDYLKTSLDALCRRGKYEWTENPSDFIRKERDSDLR